MSSLRQSNGPIRDVSRLTEADIRAIHDAAAGEDDAKVSAEAISFARRVLCAALGLDPDQFTFAAIAIPLLTGDERPVRSVRANQLPSGLAEIWLTK